jgi:hypothetical protein
MPTHDDEAERQRRGEDQADWAPHPRPKDGGDNDGRRMNLSRRSSHCSRIKIATISTMTVVLRGPRTGSITARATASTEGCGVAISTTSGCCGVPPVIAVASVLPARGRTAGVEQQLAKLMGSLSDTPERTKVEFQRLGLRITMTPYRTAEGRGFYGADVVNSLPGSQESPIYRLQGCLYPIAGTVCANRPNYPGIVPSPPNLTIRRILPSPAV